MTEPKKVYCGECKHNLRVAYLCGIGDYDSDTRHRNVNKNGDCPYYSPSWWTRVKEWFK